MGTGMNIVKTRRMENNEELESLYFSEWEPTGDSVKGDGYEA